MPVTDEAVKRFLERLEPVGEIAHRKMFGGVGLYHEGVFFGVIDDDRLYFKSDSETDPQYDAHGAAGWVIEGDPPPPLPYREVPETVQIDPAKLAAWVEAAVGVALRKKKR